MLYQQTIVMSAEENLIKINENEEIEKTKFDETIEDLIVSLNEDYAVVQKSVFGAGNCIVCIIDYCDKTDFSKLNIAPPRLAIPKM